MKKATASLLAVFFWLCSFSQSVFKNGDTTYYPRIADNGAVYRQAAYAVETPTNYNPVKSYPIIMLIHGVGERSEGKLENLRNVLLGFDYDGPGPGTRMYAVATDDFKKAVNTYQFIAVVVTYSNEFNPTDINFVFDDVEKNWNVDKTKEAAIAFSLGGGAVMRYITSSQSNADRLAVAIACAPVNWATNYNYIKPSNLPVIIATNQKDPTVDPSNAKAMYAAIGATGTSPEAKLLIFPQDGHGSINEMLSINNSWVPQNIYSYLNAISNTNPKQYPITGNTNPPPVIVPGIPTILIDDVAAITSTGTVKVEACRSTGYDVFTWQIFSVPKAANIYSNYTPKGGGYCNTTLQFSIEGAYGVKATACKGSVCVSDTLYITYQKSTTPVPVTAVSWDGETKLLTFSDGSRVNATGIIDFVNKSATVKTEAGIIYTLKL